MQYVQKNSLDFGIRTPIILFAPKDDDKWRQYLQTNKNGSYPQQQKQSFVDDNNNDNNKKKVSSTTVSSYTQRYDNGKNLRKKYSWAKEKINIKYNQKYLK